MITGRLLLISGGLDSSHRFTRVLAMLALFLFSTTAVFVAVMRVEKLEERTKRRKLADIRFMPKCVQTLHSLPRSAHTLHLHLHAHNKRGMLLPLWAMRVGFAPQPTGMPEARPDAHTQHPQPERRIPTRADTQHQTHGGRHDQPCSTGFPAG